MQSPLHSARRRVALLFFAAVASFATAQINPPSPLYPTSPTPRQGQLGESYAFLDFSQVDQRHGDGRTFGPTLGANFNVAANADCAISVTYAHQRNWPDSGNVFQFGVDWSLYKQFGRLKPFVVGGAGYQFSRTPRGSDIGLWDAGGGVEVMVAAQTAITVKAVNAGGFFRKGISNPWQYTASVNHWIAKNVAISGGVTAVEDQALAYTLGVRWGF